MGKLKIHLKTIPTLLGLIISGITVLPSCSDPVVPACDECDPACSSYDPTNASCNTTSPATNAWTPFTSNPVLEAKPGSWDSEMVSSATVFLYQDTIRMLYSGSSDAPFQGVHRVGYAWSLNGISWNRHPEPVLDTEEGNWDYPHLDGPKVLIDSDSIRMWYSGGTLTEIGMKIGYAVSTDFIHWEKHPEPVLTGNSPWNFGGVLAGPVMKEGGIYKMWFGGGDSPYGQPPPDTYWSTGYATSSNGIEWDVQVDPVLISSNNYDLNWAVGASVIMTENGYEMWYAGGYNPEYYPVVAVCHATSTDGIVWTKDEANPLITKSGGNSEALYGPSVLKDDHLRVWYTAWVLGRPSIHYAEYIESE